MRFSMLLNTFPFDACRVSIIESGVGEDVASIVAFFCAEDSAEADLAFCRLDDTASLLAFLRDIFCSICATL